MVTWSSLNPLWQRLAHGDGHGAALLRIMRQSLDDGRWGDAYLCADRLCRLEPNNAANFLLRFGTTRAFNEDTQDESDLLEASTVDPGNLDVKRAIFKWSMKGDRAEAALSLVDDGSAQDRLTALAWLRRTGRRAVAVMTGCDRDLVGWAAWDSPAPLTLHASGPGVAHSFSVHAVAGDPLADIFTSAARIRIQGGAVAYRRLDVCLGGEIVQSIRSPGPPNEDAVAPRRPKGRIGVSDARVTLIVPVFEDFDATYLCLQTALAQTDVADLRIVVVDDASPNSAIRDLLDTGAEAGLFHLIRNDHNLGFAQAVNRALIEVDGGDVVLVNADIVLPARAVAHLRAAAATDQRIGTLTPFSNNGEEMGFPRPFDVNPLPDKAGVEAINRAAHAAHGTATVDIPNGIGFCLYLTRRCLDQVNVLPDVYERGYYEDVEYCLRAREHGFRNVCATGVYVGHAGSLSFKASKRALVVKNLTTLEGRFPAYRIEAAAFAKADPLAVPRSAIERRLTPGGTVRLLAHGPGLPAVIMRERARQLGQASIDSVTLEWTGNARDGEVRLRSSTGSWPQSLRFDLRRDEDGRALVEYLRRAAIIGCELADVAACPPRLRAALEALQTPIDLVCGDRRWFDGKSGWDAQTGGRDGRANQKGWKQLGTIIPADRLAACFATAAFPHRAVSHVRVAKAKLPSRRRSAIGMLGIVVPVASPAVDRLLVALSRCLMHRRSDVRMVVLGRCTDDLAVMSGGNVFVTGPIDAADHGILAGRVGVDAVFGPFRTCLFGPLDALASELAVPKSYFDWSLGTFATAPGDLALPLECDDDDVAERLAAWCREPQDPC